MKRLKIIIVCTLKLLFVYQAGAQWTKINLRTDVSVTNRIMDVCFVNPDTGFLVTDAGVLFKSMDGGYHWTFDTINPAGAILRICFPTKDTGYMTVVGGNYPNGTILKSTNGGNSWFNTGRGNNMLRSYGLYFLSADTGMVGGGGGIFFKTVNGGQTWHWEFVGEWDICDIRFLHDSVGFIFQQCASHFATVGSLTVTRDGGNTWASNCAAAWFDGFMYSCLINDSIYIGFSTEDQLCTGNIHGNDSTLINTADSVDFPGPADYPRNIRFYDERLGMVAYSHRVMRTEDAGQTWVRTDLWSPSTPGVPNSFLELIVPITADKWIVAGENGKAFITENRGGVWTGIEDVAKQSTVTIYPNPANTTLYLNTTETKGTIEVFDLLGAVVSIKALNQGNVNTIDLTHFEPGYYIIRLTTANNSYSTKFIKE